MKQKMQSIVWLVICCHAGLVFGKNEKKEIKNSKNIVDSCWNHAAEKYGIDPLLLVAIAAKESGMNVRAVSPPNHNLTYDIGLMQINSSWLPALAEIGVLEEDLFDSCVNVQVGAWVLSESVKVFGNNWRAVGAYNAGTSRSKKAESIRMRYATDVHNRYLELQRLYQGRPSEAS